MCLSAARREARFGAAVRQSAGRTPERRLASRGAVCFARALSGGVGQSRRYWRALRHGCLFRAAGRGQAEKLGACSSLSTAQSDWSSSRASSDGPAQLGMRVSWTAVVS